MKIKILKGCASNYCPVQIIVEDDVAKNASVAASLPKKSELVNSVMLPFPVTFKSCEYDVHTV